MAIHFRCRCCRHRLSVRTRRIAGSLRCPACRNEVRIPPAEECYRQPGRASSAAPATPPRPTTAPRSPKAPVVRNPALVRWQLWLAGPALAFGLAVAVSIAPGDAVPIEEEPGVSQVSSRLVLSSEPSGIALPFRSAETTGELVEEVPAPAVVQVGPDSTSPPELAELVPPPTPKVNEGLDDRPVVAAAGFKRRQKLSEDQLRADLAGVPEIGLSTDQSNTLLSLFPTHFQTTAAVDFEPTLLLQIRPDLALLPLRQHGNHRLSASAAATLDQLSRKLHDFVEQATPRGPDGKRMDPLVLEQILRNERRGKRPEWLRAEAIPALMQILMHESASIRKLLVELLQDIPDRRATIALAQRAVFDLSPQVREAAVGALRDRPRDQCRQILLTTLRYPWPPAADHAAEVLVALEDRESVPALIMLLREPDVFAPVKSQRGTAFQRETVRMKHKTNCLTCHAPALKESDPVVGAIPDSVMRVETALRPIGETIKGERETFDIGSKTVVMRRYYNQVDTRTEPIATGSRIKGSPMPLMERVERRFGVLVRADITYLRQDFSVELTNFQPVGARQPGDRFDYMVRNRPLRPKDATRLFEITSKQETYEQKESVLFALRELTGQNLKPTFEDWKRLYPTTEEEAVALRWMDRLMEETSAQRLRTLERIRDSKGPGHTLALKRAVLRLTGTEHQKARASLEMRLEREPAEGSILDKR